MFLESPCSFELVLAGKSKNRGLFIVTIKISLVTCPLLIESISPWLVSQSSKILAHIRIVSVHGSQWVVTTSGVAAFAAGSARDTAMSHLLCVRGTQGFPTESWASQSSCHHDVGQVLRPESLGLGGDWPQPPHSCMVGTIGVCRILIDTEEKTLPLLHQGSVDVEDNCFAKELM